MRQPSLGKLLSLINRMNQRRLAGRLKEYGIGGGGVHSYLKVILHNPGLTQEELTTDLKFDKATTTRSVRQLEEAGYIERKVDEKDRRSYRLYPTAKGREFAPVLSAILKESNDRLSRDLTEHEQEQLLSLLLKVYESMNRESEESLPPGQEK
ncbi:MarR family winged helix-turn-helix transcriptional regulator [Paenibacillus pinistramenti]|uniref:MarR family winged helix-turn-helix transcriptional regulator n=1 Tax=Paenibacillus pinistramenti TaxID=1768003 RepID=UPI001109A2AD|nr:MarR family transcriptional regulator [Paenibacillus pinistramenti]